MSRFAFFVVASTIIQSGAILAQDRMPPIPPEKMADRTNKKVWQGEVPYAAGFGSGVLATAGGLLFHGGSDGFFRAYDSKTEQELWRFQTGFGADAPAATYEIDGEQYVTIAAGGSRDGSREARGDLVRSFKLGGKLNPLNAPPAPATVIKIAAPPGARD